MIIIVDTLMKEKNEWRYPTFQTTLKKKSFPSYSDEPVNKDNPSFKITFGGFLG